MSNECHYSSRNSDRRHNTPLLHRVSRPFLRSRPPITTPTASYKARLGTDWSSVDTQRPDMINIPVHSQEEEDQLARQQELRRQQMRRLQSYHLRLRESSQDPMWPRRKKSDLMSHMNPSHRLVQQRRQPADTPKEQAPVKIPIKKVAPGSQDSMWPRRRKSDLLIYQQTRNV